MRNNIILVDENDKEIAVYDKMKTHQEGKLHRAFSIFIFNSKNQMLLQKRAKDKYHSGGLWTNTCCSHNIPGVSLKEDAQNRLKEEMGISCQLREIFSFIYKVEFKEEKLFEHEYDHVFIGNFDEDPKINPEEAEDFKWIDINSLKDDVEQNPENYTYWFKLSFLRVLNYKLKNKE